MAKRSEYVEHVLETMKSFGPVEARSMFGGWGLYRHGAFFALIAKDVLYLKVDDETRAAFEAEGLEPFEFVSKGGKGTAMSYRRAPDEALENPVEMTKWARMGYEAALRAAALKASPARRAGTKGKSPGGAR